MNIQKLFNKSLRFFLYYGIFLFGLFSNNKKKINEEKEKKKKQNKKNPNRTWNFKLHCMRK